MSAWLAHAEDVAKGDLGEVAIGTDEQRGVRDGRTPRCRWGDVRAPAKRGPGERASRPHELARGVSGGEEPRRGGLFGGLQPPNPLFARLGSAASRAPCGEREGDHERPRQ